jgi:hypothetical protein
MIVRGGVWELFDEGYRGEILSLNSFRHFALDDETDRVVCSTLMPHVAESELRACGPANKEVFFTYRYPVERELAKDLQRLVCRLENEGRLEVQSY